MIESQWVDVGGLRIHVRAAGHGAPVLLVHGTGESAGDWRWTIPSLARRYRVYAPDLPGCGASDKPPIAYTPEFFSQFLNDLMDALHVPQAALVGNSIGGLAALLLALQAPERVSALSLVDSAGLGKFSNPILLPLTLTPLGDVGSVWSTFPWGEAVRAAGRGLLLFANPARIPGAWIAEQERLATMPGYLAASLSTLRAQVTPWGTERILLLDQLPTLSMPVQVVWGGLDRLLPVYQAYAAARRLRHGTLSIIPGAGHLPHVEQPAAFLDALLPFLDRQAFASEMGPPAAA